MGHGFRAERLAHPRRGGKLELKEERSIEVFLVEFALDQSIRLQ